MGMIAAAIVGALCAQNLVEARFSQPGEWLTYDRDNTAQRYSPLDQVNTSNIKRLAVEWAFQLEHPAFRTEVTPLVRDGVMYITNGGEEAFALDARTGRTLWNFHYTPKSKSRLANWNRGFALSGNRLFMATSDAGLLALDARNGAQLWRVQLEDPELRYGATAAPLVVKDLVLIGVRGGDTGLVRGFLDAYRVETGERAWRFHTVPAPGETGSETWPKNDSWKGGGAATWTTGSYDPNLNLIYWTTGNPGPQDYDGRNRQGDNLYASSVLALTPEGKLRWHYQFTPHDTHDWDANETPMLVDAVWHGKPRKLLLQANRNAFFYVLDRTSGELLLAEPFAKQTWAKRIGSDGRPELMPNTEPSIKGTLTCPDVHGGTNWQPPSYSPLSGLFYVMARDGCMRYRLTGPDFQPGDGAPVQSLRAIDIQTGKVRWESPFIGQPDISHAGAMATAGGLVFFAQREGQFIAADAKTGKLLWNFYTGGRIRAAPVSYTVMGKQYIAIASKAAVFSFALR